MNQKPPEKKPVIMEMGSDKYKPNHTVTHLSDDGVEKVQFVF